MHDEIEPQPWRYHKDMQIFANEDPYVEALKEAAMNCTICNESGITRRSQIIKNVAAKRSKSADQKATG